MKNIKLLNYLGLWVSYVDFINGQFAYSLSDSNVISFKLNLEGYEPYVFTISLGGQRGA